jgi:hypothetical protein
MLNIKQRQKNLRATAYYFGAADGIEGRLTKAAYLKFQHDQKLLVDGIYGKETETALIEYIKELQRALNKAGTKLSADGLVGRKTIQAIKKFQKNKRLIVDGIIGSKTMHALEPYMMSQTVGKVNWERVKYFKRREFICPCNHCNGFPAEPNSVLIALLERAREHFNLPIHITSGVRCAYQNNKVGGIKNSKHRDGKAADCSLDFNSDNDLKLKKWFMQQPEVSYTYTGFGAVHVDVK